MRQVYANMLRTIRSFMLNSIVFSLFSSVLLTMFVPLTETNREIINAVIGIIMLPVALISVVFMIFALPLLVWWINQESDHAKR